VYVGIILSVPLSKTKVLYNVILCMKEDNPCPNLFKGDDKKYRTGLSVCDLTQSSSNHLYDNKKGLIINLKTDLNLFNL